MKTFQYAVLAALALSSVPVLAGEGQRKGPKSFERLDSDGNQALSKEEVAAAPRLSSKFERVDTDKNGVISKDELETFRAQHRHHPRKGPAAP